MSHEIAVRKKKEISFAATHGLFLGYMLLIYAVALYGIGFGLVAGSPGLVAYSALSLLIWTWAFGSALIAVPLSIYLNKHYTDKNYAAVDKVHGQALKLLSCLPVRKDAVVATTMSNLALARLCQGYFDSAESLFQQAIEYVERDKRIAKSFSGGILYNNLGAANLKTGKFIEAELNATRSLDIANLPRNKKSFPLMAAPPLAVLATARLKLNEFDSALEHFEQALHIYDSSPLPLGVIPASHEQGRNMTYLGLALTQAKLTNWDESKKWCDLLLTRVRTDPSSINTLSLDGLNLLANEFMNVQNYPLAEQILELAYLLGKPYPFHPHARQTLKYYEKLFLLTGRNDEIEDMKTWLREVPLLTASA